MDWSDIIRRASVYAVYGDRGSGKSALAYYLMERFGKEYTLTPVTVGPPPEARQLLPESFVMADTVQEALRVHDAIFFVDEAGLQFPLEDKKAHQPAGLAPSPGPDSPDGLPLPGVAQILLGAGRRRRCAAKNLEAAVSWVGLTALGYVSILALTSNDLSQRWLGRSWKDLHGQSHSLFVLAVIQPVLAAYLLVESPGAVFRYALWVGVALTVGLHLADFIATVSKRRRAR